MTSLFWISLMIVFYTFLGYGILLYILVKLKRAFNKKLIYQAGLQSDLPSCTLIVAAYNEQEIMHQKIQNTLGLIYPPAKLEVIFITDGSIDKTPEIVSQYNDIRLMHSVERKGKIAAVHRAVSSANNEILVFTDANTFLNANALINICRHYRDVKVGAVAGEKRIHLNDNADASTAGEGFYWKYESTLKRWDSELYSVVGAAGELFSVRKSLYTPVGSDIILDDFMISMNIAADGYKIVYEPEAFAVENASEDVAEELKRKVRIAAGGIQSIIKLKRLLNVFRYGTLSFQYISHRVLRWTVTPFFLALLFFSSIKLTVDDGGSFYCLALAAQILFYLLAILGMYFEKQKIRIKIAFIPYYFCIMNYAVIAGIIRYFGKGQSAIWEKAKRKL